MVVMETGTQLDLYFTLALQTGEMVESCTEEPLNMTLGDGNLAAPLEAIVELMQPGEKREVSLQQPFGELDRDYIHWMDKALFEPQLELTEGLIMSFEDPDGQEYNGTLMDIVDDQIKVDFNHPLAGQDIVFSVELLKVYGSEK